MLTSALCSAPAHAEATRTPAPAGVLVWIALFVALLAGCAAPQSQSLRAGPPAGLPPMVELKDVPFFPQELHQCGPAALATAFNYWGRRTTADALTNEVYLPAREGSLQPEMLATARRHGLLAYPLAPRLEDLLREVAAGHPVIVLQNLSLPIMPRWHYAVVVGYDLPNRELVLRSGTIQRLVMSMDTFEHTWARSGYWSFVASPPARLPATATESGGVQSAIALERADAAAALQAYEAILARWPQNYVATMGRGNAAYRLKRWTVSVEAFRRATVLNPREGDAWNNLAEALAASGDAAGAASAAQRAVDAGGSRVARYRETLERLSKVGGR